MKHLAKRSLSLLLAVLMVLSLCPVTALTVFAEHTGEWTYKSSLEWINGSFKTEDTDLVYEGDQPYDWSVVITPQKTPAPTVDVVASIKDAQGNLVSEYAGTAIGLAQHTEGTLCSSADFPELTADLEGTFTLTCQMLYKGVMYAQLVQTFSRVCEGGAAVETTEGDVVETTVATEPVETQPTVSETYTFTDGWTFASGWETRLQCSLVSTDSDLVFEEGQPVNWDIYFGQMLGRYAITAHVTVSQDGAVVGSTVSKTTSTEKGVITKLFSAADYAALTDNMYGTFDLRCEIEVLGKIYAMLDTTFTRVSEEDDVGGEVPNAPCVSNAKAYLDLTQSAVMENITGLAGLDTAINPPAAISVGTVIKDDIVAWNLGPIALSFTLSEEFLKDFDGNVRITVEYFDVSTGTASLVYHSTGSTETIHPTTMAPAGNNDFSVQTAVFKLTDAVFTNLYEKGSSFAILGLGGGRFYLKSVTVTKKESPHDWIAATCTAPMTCRICGATEGEVLAHSYENNVCTVCGCNVLTYKLNEAGDGYIVSDCDTTVNGELVIPETYNGLPVISIGWSAFEECSSLTSITIPGGVTSIGSEAFAFCNNLHTVAIPNSVTKISTNAFFLCEALETVIYCGTQTQWDVVEKGGYYCYLGHPFAYTSEPCKGCAFADPITSETLQFHKYVDGVCYYCGHIEDNPTNCEHVWIDATCTAPKTCNLCGVTEGEALGHSYENGACTVCGQADENDNSVLTFTLNETGDGYIVSDCDLSARGELVIPATYNGLPVTSIGIDAFRFCSNLTNITIPAGITDIGNGAFYLCAGLTDIAIPVGVTNIGESAFSACSGLTSITIPNSVVIIGPDAFSGCTSLTSITIPNSVTSIGVGAFTYCNNLVELTVADGNAVYYSTGNCIIETGSKTLIVGCQTSNIPSDGSVICIGDSAFNGCDGLTSITIPDSVVRIGNGAFINCDGLTSITLPNGVSSIGGSAFSGCAGLTSILIPDSVTSIGSYAFNHCTSLTDIAILDGVTSISEGMFQNCRSLTSVTIPESVTAIDRGAFYGCTSLTNINIPDSVTTIGRYAFRECYHLTNLTIPASVTAIDKGTFWDCTNLMSITIPDSVISFGEMVFLNCSSLVTVIYCGTQEQWDAITIDSNNDALMNATLQMHNYENGVCTVCQAIEGGKLEGSVEAVVTSVSNPDLIFTEGEQFDLVLHLRKTSGVAEAFKAILTITDKDGNVLKEKEAKVPEGEIMKVSIQSLIDLTDLPATGSFNLNIVMVDAAGNERVNVDAPFARVKLASVKTQVSSDTNADMIFIDKDTVDLNLYVQKTDDIAEELFVRHTVFDPDGIEIVSSEGKTIIPAGENYIKQAIEMGPEQTAPHGTYSVKLTITDNTGNVRSETTTKFVRISGAPDEIKHQVCGSSTGNKMQFTSAADLDLCLFLQKLDGVPETLRGELYVTAPSGKVVYSIKGNLNVPAGSSYFKLPLPLADKAIEFGTYEVSYTMTDDAGNPRVSNTVSFSIGSCVHDWTDASCTEPKTCSLCGVTEGEALGHTPAEAVKENEIPATPEAEGSYDEVIYCSICGAELSRNTVVTEKTIVDTVIPDDGVSGDDGQELTEEQQEIVQQILEQSKQVQEALNLPDNTYLKITMSSAKVDGEKVTRITYKVKPITEGKENSNPGQKITFYLPVPYQTAKSVASVFHNGILLGTDFVIKTNGTEKWVEVTSDNFSEFSVDLEYADENEKQSATLTVTTDADTYYRGDTVIVTVSTSPIEHSTSGGFVFTYETNVFEYISGEALVTGYSGAGVSTINENIAGYYMGGDATVQGDIFRITLKVKDTADFISYSISGIPSFNTKIGDVKDTVTCTTEDVTINVICNHSFGEWIKLNEAEHKHICSICSYEETELIEYTVLFQYADGTVISSAVYHYGDPIEVPMDPPAQFENNAFMGWDQEIVNCAGDTVYTAVFIEYIPGDIDTNGTLNDDDAVYLLLYTMFGEEFYPLSYVPADVDSNASVDHNDAIYLLLHVLFGEDFYPLYNPVLLPEDDEDILV